MTSELRRRMDAFSKRNQTMKQGARLVAYSRLTDQVFASVRPYKVPAMVERVNTGNATPSDTQVLEALDAGDLGIVGLTPAEFLAEVGKAIERASQLF